MLLAGGLFFYFNIKPASCILSGLLESKTSLGFLVQLSLTFFDEIHMAVEGGHTY